MYSYPFPIVSYYGSLLLKHSVYSKLLCKLGQDLLDIQHKATLTLQAETTTIAEN